MANRHYHFKFNVEKDATYIQRLDAQENMQNYIRRLILSDIAADGLRDMIQLAPENEKPDLHDYCKHCEHEEETDAPECKSCPHGDLDPEAIEFQRRADLMARYCHGVGDDSDPEYCISCVWSYHPDNYSDVIRCKFEGLSADEMEQLIMKWHKRIINRAYGKAVTDERSN